MNPGPMFVAILPQAAADANGGADGLLVKLQAAVGLNGTYALIAGKSFRAGSTDLRSGQAGELATEAFQAHRSEGASGVLADFVRRIAAARASGGTSGSGATGSSGGHGNRSWLLPLLGILGIGIGGGVLYTRRKQKAFEKQAFQEVREGVRGDLQDLSTDILALDTPTMDKPDARAHYGRAIGGLEQGRAGARHRGEAGGPAGDLRRDRGRALRDGVHARRARRQAGARAPRAVLLRPEPRAERARRAVDGPSGGTRDVPACQRCVDALEHGEQPATKTVVMQGQTVPYWSAGGPWQVYHGGFFGGFGGGGFLQGLILGEILTGGGGFGGGPFGGGGGDGGGRRRRRLGRLRRRWRRRLRRRRLRRRGRWRRQVEAAATGSRRRPHGPLRE